MRLALVDDTVPCLAVFHALLAFSSLCHRHGPHQEAVQLKVLALQYLSASMREGQPLSLAAASQVVAASMLLSACEVCC